MRPRRDTEETDFKFVVERLNQIDEEERDRALEQLSHLHRVPDVSVPSARAASTAEMAQAIEQAKGGNPEKLFEMILPVWAGRGKMAINPSIGQIPIEGWGLLFDYGIGQRKAKPKLGRPKASAGARRAMTRVHDAARLVSSVERVLRGKYPSERGKWIRERAIVFAARIERMKSTTLANYLARPPGDRRRLPPKKQFPFGD